MRINRKLKIAILLVLTLGYGCAWASAYNNTMSVVSVSRRLIFALCQLTGVLFIGMGLIRYQQYRQNPSETPLNRVLYVLLFGIAMLVLPYIAQKAEIQATINNDAVAAGE